MTASSEYGARIVSEDRIFGIPSSSSPLPQRDHVMSQTAILDSETFEAPLHPRPAHRHFIHPTRRDVPLLLARAKRSPVRDDAP